MIADRKTLAKAFGPKMLTAALVSFDRLTAMIALVAWGVVFALMAATIYTFILLGNAKRDVADAAAREPSLPRMTTKTPSSSEMVPFVDRQKKRFPTLAFSLAPDQSLTVTATDGSQFRIWLNALGSIDASTQYRWTLKEFCVGLKCGSNAPMRALLAPEKVTFSPPEKNEPGSG